MGIVGIVSGIATGGLTIVISEFLQVVVLGIFTAINALMAVAIGLGGGQASLVGLKNIIFNKGGSLTTANFFAFQGGDQSAFAANVQKYYGIIMNLSIALLLFVLIYIGIRMALSTVAEREAKYKQMFKDWAVSLILVFVLHLIIMATFLINDTLVKTLGSTVGDETNALNVIGGLVVPRTGSNNRLG